MHLNPDLPSIPLDNQISQATSAPSGIEISSFSYKVYEFVANSNFFNPSNFEPRLLDDQGSLNETLKDSLVTTLNKINRKEDSSAEGIDLFKRIKKTETLHFIGKPFRVALRLLALVGGTCVASPLGVLWNGGLLCRTSFQWLKSEKGSEEAKQLSQKIEAYAHSFFIDLTVGSLAAVTLAVSIASLPIFATAEGLLGLAAGGFFSIPFSHAALRPRDGIQYFLPGDSCVGPFISMLLKDQFGLMGDDGSLLEFNPDIDKQDEYSGVLAQMVNLAAERYKKTLEIFAVLECYSNLSPADCTPKSIIAELKRLGKFSTIEFWEEELIEAYEEYDKLYDEVINLAKLQIKGNPIFNLMAHRSANTNFITKVDQFKNEELAEEIFVRVNKDSFEDSLERVRKSEVESSLLFLLNLLKQLNHRIRIFETDEEGTYKYKEPYQILGFEAMPTSKEEVEEQYNSLIEEINPLLYLGEMQVEVKKIYDCLTAAYRLLLESFK